MADATGSSALRLIPQPQSVRLGRGAASAALGAVRVESDAFPEETAHGIKDAGLRVSPRSKRRIRVRERRLGHDQAYTLRTTPGGVEIAAQAPVGVYYAFQTLAQLLLAIPAPQVAIEDAPDHAIRGIHFDLKRAMPSYPYLLESIRTLGRLKLNAALMEYEDKFPYRRFPDLHHPDAFTRAQLHSIMSLAEQCHVEVIPLVQTFGHVECFLKHPRYHALRERPDSAWTLCPLNESSLEFIETLVGEIIEAHPNSSHVHVGGDEAYDLAVCPRCKAFAARHGVSRLIVEHFNRVAKMALARGRTPIVWHDMLVNHPESIAALDKRIRVAYWEYRDDAPVLDNNMVACGPKWQARYHAPAVVRRIPAHIRRTFAPYWWTGGKEKRLKGFAYLQFFKDQGLAPWGCSATRSAESGFPNYQESCANIREYALCARTARAEAMVNTSWAGSGVPLETAWYGHYWAADCFWNVRAARDAFDRAFARIFYGTDELEPVSVYTLLSDQDMPGRITDLLRADRLVRKWRAKVTRNKPNLDVLDMTVKRFLHRIHISWFLYYELEMYCARQDLTLDQKTARLKSVLDRLRREGDAVKKLARRALKGMIARRSCEEDLAWGFDHVGRCLKLFDANLTALVTPDPRGRSGS